MLETLRSSATGPGSQESQAQTDISNLVLEVTDLEHMGAKFDLRFRFGSSPDLMVTNPRKSLLTEDSIIDMPLTLRSVGRSNSIATTFESEGVHTHATLGIREPRDNSQPALGNSGFHQQLYKAALCGRESQPFQVGWFLNE